MQAFPFPGYASWDVKVKKQLISWLVRLWFLLSLHTASSLPCPHMGTCEEVGS